MDKRKNKKSQGWFVAALAALMLFGVSQNSHAQKRIKWLQNGRLEFSTTFTTTERDALTGLTSGDPHLIYNETDLGFQISTDGTTWASLASILDGDTLDVDYAPTNYTAASATLASHLTGIDAILATIAGGGVLNKFDATADPGVGDDTGDGYAIGSRWINITSDTIFEAADVTTGAAVWKNLSSSASGGPLNKFDATADPTTGDDTGDGYSVGSHWVNVTADKVFVCADATAAAAVWKDLSSSAGGGITDVVSDVSPQLGGTLDANSFSIALDTGTGITDGNGNEQLTFTTTASAVNEITMSNAATGNGVSITATGGDTNIDFLIAGKGTGVVKANGSQVITLTDDEFSGLTEKTTMANNDLILIEDSAASGAKKKVKWSSLPSGGGGGGSSSVFFFLKDADGRYDGSDDLVSDVDYLLKPQHENEGTALATLVGSTAAGEFSSLSELETEIESEIDAGTVTATWDDVNDLLTLEFSEVPKIGGDVILSVAVSGADHVANFGGGLSGDSLFPLTLSGADVSGTLPIASGGTNATTATAGFENLSPLTAKGSIISHDGTDTEVLPVGTNGYVLSASSASATGLKWAAVSGASDATGDAYNNPPQVFTPTTEQALTTTYVDVDGSSITYTPQWDDSEIIYKYRFHAARGDSDGISHLKFYVGGVEQTGWSTTERLPNTDSTLNFKAVYSNTSTSVKTFKMMARDYSTSNDVKLHETYHFDGAASNVLVKAILEIKEIKN